MSEVQKLRASVSQRLSAAAEEILELFERTVAEYEEQLRRSTEENKRQQKLLDAVFRPEVRILRADVQQLLRDEVPPEQQQQRSSSLHQEEPPHVKEEEEKVWRAEQLRWLEEADGTKFTPAPAESHVETPPSPQLLLNQPEESRDAAERLATPADGEPDVRLAPAGVYDTPRAEEKGDEKRLKTESGADDCGVSPLHRLHAAPLHVDAQDSSECETEDSCEWEQSRELQPGFDRVTGNTPGGCSGRLQQLGTQHAEKKPLSCSVCGKKYSVRNSLRTHMRLHSEGKHFSCSVCQKTFPWKEKVVRHMRVHTGEKPFGCTVCGAKFTDSSNLTSHLKVHTGEKLFSCLVCKAGFGCRNNLVKHMRVHGVSTKKKLFSCVTCGKLYSQKGNLTRHQAVHAGEKPHCCSVCGKRFTRLEYVKKHKCRATE